MGKPANSDDVASMLEMAKGYFEQIVEEWIAAPDYRSGLARVKMLFSNGHDCVKIAIDRAGELAAEEEGQDA
jgi:hypothetical protein